MKKFTIIILCGMLCAATLTNAQFQSGSGTETDPYIISTPAQLVELAMLVQEPTPIGDEGYIRKHYKLANNIDLSGYNAENTNFNNGRGWIPIGTDWDTPFRDVFDGDGKSITELYINNNTSSAVGLFGFMSGATIRNLSITNADVTGSQYTGGIAGGMINNSRLENCHVSGVIKSNSSAVGGIVGLVNLSSVSNCYANVEVIGNSQVGGIVGELYGTLNACYVTGMVTGTQDVGGLAGSNGGSITNSAALNLSVKGNANTGRITGYPLSS